MIRVSTLGFLLLAGALCLAVFSIKHQVIALENRWNEVNREIARDQQAIHVLRAEWSYLNDPQRLRRLAATHLEMTPMVGAQIVGFPDLPARPEDPDAKPDETPATSPAAPATPSAPAMPPALATPTMPAAPSRPVAVGRLIDEAKATPVSVPITGGGR